MAFCCHRADGEAFSVPLIKVAGGPYRPSDTRLPVSCLLGLCRQTLDLVGPGAKVSVAHGPVSW